MPQSKSATFQYFSGCTTFLTCKPHLHYQLITLLNHSTLSCERGDFPQAITDRFCTIREAFPATLTAPLDSSCSWRWRPRPSIICLMLVVCASTTFPSTRCKRESTSKSKSEATFDAEDFLLKLFFS